MLQQTLLYEKKTYEMAIPFSALFAISFFISISITFSISFSTLFPISLAFLFSSIIKILYLILGPSIGQKDTSPTVCSFPNLSHF